MPTTPVFLVHLRRPTTEPNEMRSDPFWEFGSFGLTGCHSKNLMNPKNIDRLQGAKLAFAQGGPEGMKLVFLTPPVEITQHASGRLQANWTPHEMPFRYSHAPKLAAKGGVGDFPLLEKQLSQGQRTTAQAQFSSNFRSRSTALASDVAKEITTVYAKMRKKGTPAAIAENYVDALPHMPPRPDLNRARTFKRLSTKARREAIENSSNCGSSCKQETPIKPSSKC